MTYFFLSYARLDENDNEPYIERFFTDLNNDVRSLLGLDRDETIGFRDATTIGLGKSWPKELKHALGKSRTLVCLYSPTYFKREFCGKEWAAFQSRLDNQYQGCHPPLIVPILWETMEFADHFPKFANDLQWKNESFGEQYSEFGLRALMKTKKYIEQYNDFRSKFSRHLAGIIKDGGNNLKQADIEDISSYHNIFMKAPDEAREKNSQLSQSGPRKVTFIIAAATMEEIKLVRNACEPYGSEALDWRPFHPHFQDEICLYAQEIAAKEHSLAMFHPIKENFLEKIEKAEKFNEIVIILIDAWIMKIERYRRWIEKYEKVIFINSGVLVVWNSKDDETNRNQDVLNNYLRQSFHYKMSVHRDERTFHHNVETIESFKEELRSTLIDIRSRIFEKSRLMRQVKSSNFISQPYISNISSNN